MMEKEMNDDSITSTHFSREEKYWLDKLDGELMRTTFPYDFQPTGMEKRKIETMKFEFQGEIFSKLMKLSKGSYPKLHMIAVAALTVLLYKYNDKKDIILGIPIFKQESEAEFLNTILPLRNHLKDDMTFKDLLLQVRQSITEADENQNYPIEMLLQKLKIPFSRSDDFPLFDIGILLDNIHDRKYLENIHCNMIFTFSRTDRQLTGKLEFNAPAFKKSTIERIVSHFTHLLEEALDNPHTTLSDLELLTAEEKKQVMYDFNDRKLEYPKDKTIPQLFEAQVETTPERLAVVSPDGDVALTYKELDKSANRLAYLLRSKGVKPGDMVGLMVEPSLEMVLGIIGIIKAGAAYLPLDPQLPANRLHSILNDCGAPLVLTSQQTTDTIAASKFFPGVPRPTPAKEGLFLTGQRPIITNLAQLPIPDRSLVDYEKYNQYIGQTLVKNCISLLGSRGCPFSCAYCHNIWPKGHIVRTARNSFEEIQLYYNQGVRRFAFVDDVFNVNTGNSMRLFELIIENGLDLQLFLALRGDILTEEYIDLMVKAGTVRVSVALETASPRLQKLMKKNLDIEKFRRNISYICEKYPNVILELNTMIGFPTETEEEALKTLEFIKSLKWVHLPYVHILKIYSNTEMEKIAIEKGISKGAIASSANLAYHELPETLPFSKEFVLGYQSRFLNEYFLDKERLLHVIPYQMKILTEDEMVQKYNSYLPIDINDFDGLLEFLEISRDEMRTRDCITEEAIAIPDFNEKLGRIFPAPRPGKDALKILLLDLSQLFSSDSHMLYDVVEPPLGLMYLMTYLNRKFGDKINGRIAKSRIDFDNYHQLKAMLEEFQPDIIGIRTLTYFREFFHQVVAMIRHWGIEVPIITGGPYATSDYATILQDPNVDLVVLGEGEITLTELVEKIMGNNRKLPGHSILKEITGLAYIPLKKEERMTAGPTILMQDEWTAGLTGQLVENLPHVNQPNDPVYTIFTSGSTGIPKGVVIAHRNLNNLIAGLNDRIYKHYTRPLKISLLSPFIFDASVKQIFGVLLLGHCLHIVPEKTRIDSERLLEFYNRYKIDVSDGTPTHLDMMLESMGDNGRVPGVKNFLIGGEELNLATVKRFFAHLKTNDSKITNMYGLTECCVDSTAFEITKENIETLDKIPLGQPMANQEIYIVAKNNKLQPLGVVGQLCISGENVAWGYMNQPELTTEKFLSISSKSSGFYMSDMFYMSYIYKTGDLARWLNCGNIEFIGRIDHQVKIRGARIELGEIENLLLRNEMVKDTIVIIKEDKSGDKFLCAYIVLKNHETLQIGKKVELHNQFSQYLAKELPAYMFPRFYITLEEIPLTPNGKKDRKALPEPGSVAAVYDHKPHADEIEEKLLRLWSDVLGIEKNSISTGDNFFQLGGHSLKATILVSKIHKTFNVKVPVAEVFQKATVKDLAKYIKEAAKVRFFTIQPAEKKEYHLVSSAQKRMYVVQQMDIKGTGYNMLKIVALQGIIDKKKLENTFKKLIQRHDSLRTLFIIVKDRLVQKIREHVKFNLEYFDLANHRINDVETIVFNFVKPFDLSRPPLLRVGLIKTGDQKYILLADLHHIISDAVSNEILVKDFRDLSEGKELMPLRIQFKDYSEWYNSEKKQNAIKLQEEFWLNRLKGNLPILNLPVDYPRPAVQSFSGGIMEFEVDMEQTLALKKYAREENTTLFVVLLAIYYVFLAKVCQQEDIMVGTVTAGRNHEDLQHLIGLFVNVLLLRNYPSREKTFGQLVKEVGESTTSAFENQDYPFEKLVDKLVIKRDLGRFPLLDTGFGFQTIEKEIPGRQDKVNEFVEGIARVDLTLLALETKSQLFFSFEYAVKLFKQKKIEQFIKYYKTLVVSAIENPGKKLDEMEIIPTDEKNYIQSEILNTAEVLQAEFDI